MKLNFQQKKINKLDIFSNEQIQIALAISFAIVIGIQLLFSNRSNIGNKTSVNNVHPIYPAIENIKFLKKINSVKATKQSAVFPVIYSIGDSLTKDGTYESKLLSNLGSNWTIFNKGYIGETTSEILAKFNEDVIKPRNASYVIVWAGVNDIWKGYSAYKIEYNLQSMYSLAHDAGIKVVACTITPFKDYLHYDSRMQSVIDNVNAYILNEAFDIDYRVDLWSALVDPNNPNTLLRDYDDGKHLHLSTDGYVKVADTIYKNVLWNKILF
jgi:lysophospholipase L1-like esterase